MTKWIDVEQAAAQLDIDLSAFRRLVRSSRNPPPYVRPSERSMLFDRDRLREWQQTWTTSDGSKLTT
jgi:hypothetical protein